MLSFNNEETKTWFSNKEDGKEKFKRLFWPWRRRDLFISIFSIPSKVEFFSLGQNQTSLMSERGNESAKKPCHKLEPSRCMLLEDAGVGLNEQKNYWDCLIASHTNLCKYFITLYFCLVAVFCFMSSLDMSTEPCGLSAGPPTQALQMQLYVGQAPANRDTLCLHWVVGPTALVSAGWES